MKLTTFTLLAATTVFCGKTMAEDLTCLSNSERETGNLYAHLQKEAYAALDRRNEAYEQLKTPEQIRAHQKKLREFLIQQLGGFPQRTPLNAETIRTIKADGYRIECVIFESQPHHHVTANLYLPDVDGPTAGIVVSSGHSRTGKTAEYNQRFGIAMAKHGMAALCFDPIGQGERSQILNEQGAPKFGSTTAEHFLVGVGSTLVGRNTARYRIWDAIRAIDYLAGRREVDADRIGFTGCSGGGTLTSYVMALDDRVVCAAPACYLTTFRRLIETIGPQDAEQNIFGQIAFGMDQPDYVLMRAPKPTIISSTTNDFFDSSGSWDNYRQAKRIYARLGFPERVDLVEVEGGHGVQPQNLATITHWMKRWLLNRDEPVAAIAAADFPTRTPAELLCTESGQVLKSLPDEKSVFDLNAQYETRLAVKRRQFWKATPHDEVLDRIRRLLGVRPNSELKQPKLKELGRVTKDGRDIDKLVLTTQSGVPLPALMFHPSSPSDDAWLYLHDRGKTGDVGSGGSVEKLVDDGHTVVTIDLSGQGETGPDKYDPLLTDWKTYYLSYLLGKPLLGIRVEDTLAAADFVARYRTDRNDRRKVHLVGVGQAGIVALHAAALHPKLFASVTLRNTPRDWSTIVRLDTPTGQLDSAVHGALEYYDLPDLARLISKKVRFED
jgi:cephalosporin-C deacetylase-like acetyl esterase